jgi:uncharacterized protein (TIGR02246 family)
MSKLTTLVVITLLAACSEAPQPQADLDGLKGMGDAWQAGFNARDAAAIAAVYAENGSLLPPNVKTVKGRAAIEAYWVEFMASGIGGGITDTNVNASGDVGYKVGTYTITSPYGELLDDGKYVEVWHYMDGRWQMMYDIFNSNRPVSASAADDEARVMDEE